MRAKKPLPEGVKIAIRWVIYVFCAFLCFAFSTQGASGTPKAIVLFPLAIAIAVFEGEVPAAVTGTVAGLLIDISADKLLGFTAFVMCISCGLVSALFRQFLRKNIINYLVTVVLITAVYLYVDYYLFYRIWDYEGIESVLKAVLLPSWLKTVLWSPVVFGGVWLVDKLTGPFRQLVIEEQAEGVDRI
ncbi:MAG: rod shape-determining protein MreD [Oscillospiraceae bacterium]|nr:rod shape-determining protein MreD [Oscillospiraceae bacterium]